MQHFILKKYNFKLNIIYDYFIIISNVYICVIYICVLNMTFSLYLHI